MLTLTLSATDSEPEVELRLEHSLVSLSKWESHYKKPFFNRDGMDNPQTLVYIEYMLLDRPPAGNWQKRLTAEHYYKVGQYINDPQTATTFRENPNERRSNEVVTSELIYYWMISFQIPFEPCQNWHLNRLMTLIKIAGVKQSKPKKMSRQQQAEEYRRLNELRRQQLGTNG